MKVVASLVVGLVLLAAACGDDDRLAPVGGGGGPLSSSSSSSSVVTTGAGGEAPPEPAPLRQVFQRDPFGNVAEARNLLWDGDFEWESAFADQYGWLEKGQFGLRQPLAGAACRSGVKCVRLASNSNLIGIGVSSSERKLHGSVWIRPEGGADCTAPEVTLFSDPFEELPVDDVLPPDAAAPDAEGWCHYQALVPQRRDKTYLLIEVPVIGTSAVVDDAVLRAATDEEEAQPTARSFVVPTAEHVVRVEEARRALVITRGPREGAPDPARRAFERWGRGEGRVHLRATPAVRRGVK